MKTTYKLFTCMLVWMILISISTASAQCFTASWGQYPGATFSPSCNGTEAEVTSCGYRGEYSVVDVTNGNLYVFRSSIPTDLITVSDLGATTAYAFGISGGAGISWVATFTGTIRFYTHTNTSCGEASGCMSRYVTCTSPSGNDEIGNAATITCGQTLTGSTVSATIGTEAGLPFCGTSGGTAPGIWYYINTIPTQQITADLCASGYDTKVHIYSSSTGTAAGVLTCVAGNDDNCPGFRSAVTWTATGVPGNRYYIYVHGYQTSTGDVSLTVNCVNPIPANDNCSGAITMTPTTVCNPIYGATFFSTQELAPSLCSGYTSPGANEVWYSFNANGTFNYTVSMTGTGGMDAVIQLYSGSCGALTSLGCSDNSFSNGTELVSAGVLAAGTYYYRIYSYGTGFGEFTTCVTYSGVPPPPNDQCQNVTPFVLTQGVPHTFTGTTAGATTANDGIFNAYPMVWEAITVTGACNNIVVDYCGTTPAIVYTYAYLVTGCPSVGFIPYNTIDWGLCGLNPTMTFNNIPAGTYYIPVLGEYDINPVGPYTVNITSTDCPTAPANDLICNAVNLSCGASVSGTTIDATTINETGLPFCGTSGGTAGGVWYQITPPAGNIVTLNTCTGTGYDSKMHVFSSSDNTCTGTLSCVAGNDDFCGLQSQVSFTSNGSTYFVLVHGYNANIGDFIITTTCEAPPANDECSGATPISCGGSVSGNTTGASDDVFPACGSTSSGQYRGVWHTIDLPSTGIIEISTCGGNTTWDSYLRIYSGSCGSLVCEGANDDFCGLQSTVTTGVLSAGTYYILVSGYGSASAGNYTLYATCTLCAGSPVAATITGPADGCTGGELNYSASGYSATSIQWQYSIGSASGPFSDIPGANSANLNFIPSVPDVHYFTVVSSSPGCFNANSNLVTTNIISSGAILTAGTSAASPFCPDDQISLLGNTILDAGTCTTVNGFTGDLAPATWSFSNIPATYGLGTDGSVNTSGAPANIIINGGDNIDDGSFTSPQETRYMHEITCSGNITFNWSYITGDEIPLYDYPLYTTDGGNTWNFLTGFALFGSLSQSGTETIAVSSGTTFGLQMYSADGFSDGGQLTITNASFPNATALSLPSYSWSGPGGFGSSAQNPNLTITSGSAGTYTVVGTTPNGCQLSSSITIGVLIKPVPQLGSNSAAVCENDQLILSAFDGTSYYWSGPGNSGTTSGSPLGGSTYTFLNLQEINEGSYSVTVTNSDGCSATESVFIQVNDRPEPYLISLTCGLTNNSTFEVGVNGGTAPYTFSESLTSETNGDGIFDGLADGTYTVTISDDATPSCSSLNPLVVPIVTTPNTAPVFSICPINIVTTNTPGQCGAIVTYVAPIATDNCPNGFSTSMVSGIASGNFFPIGTTTVIYRATDLLGVTTDCSFNVTVNDTEFPVFSSGSVCPPSFTACNPITWIAPTFTDNCPGLLVTSSHTPGTNFAEGTTTVTYTARDLKNNITSCTFNVTVLDTSEAATSITSNRDYHNICLGGDITLSINGGHLGEVTAGVPAQWKWYSGSCTGTPAGTGTSITVSPTATTTYYARPEGACNLPACASVTVIVSTAPPSSNITYSNVPAYGSPGMTATLSVNPVPGAVFYRWYTINGHVNSVLFDGFVGPFETTVPTTQVTFALPEQMYHFRVLAGNGCGRTNATNTSVRGTVEAPTSMNGPIQACPGNVVTYSIPPVTSNSPASYNWALVPASAGTIVMAPNGLSATVTFAVGFTTAQVCANGISTFGLPGPAYCLTVSTSAPTPGAVSGNASPCINNAYSYSIPAGLPGATYAWSSLAGTVQSVAPDGLSAVILFQNSAFTNSTVCVTASSGCGASAPSCLTVSSGTPGNPGNINGPASGVCDASNVNYSLLTTNANSYQWSVSANMSMTGTTTNNSVSVNFLNGFTSGIVSVTAYYNCGSVVKTFNVSGAPQLPVILPAAVCPSTALTYFVTNAATGVDYTWSTSGDILDFACTNPECSQFFIEAGSGGGTYEVTATNACGSSVPVSSGACRMAPSQMTMQIHPNPTTGLITVEFSSEMGGQYQVTLTDLSGRVIMVEDFKAVSGRNQHELDLGFANTGLYMVYLKNGNGEIAVRKIAVE